MRWTSRSPLPDRPRVHGATAFVTRPVPEAGLAILRDAGVAVVIGEPDPERALPREALIAGARAADVLVSQLSETIDDAVLGAGPRLRGVANYAVGFNNVAIDAATAHGIPVTNTPDVLTDTTADFGWALLMAVARRVVEGDAFVRAGAFRVPTPSLFLGADVSPGGYGRRKVLGIVGYGRIGAAVARRAIGFDMDVVAWTPHGVDRIERDAAEPGRRLRAASLDELVATSDFVVLTVALTPETRHLIGAAQLAAMPPGAFLVNIARGPVVDETALVAALRDRRIAGAALDVYEHEPALTPGLAELPNVVLAPHIAGSSHDTRNHMAELVAVDALAHLRGERSPRTVNPAVYDTPACHARQPHA